MNVESQTQNGNAPNAGAMRVKRVLMGWRVVVIIAPHSFRILRSIKNIRHLRQKLNFRIKPIRDMGAD
jgi:hypothetical protein